MTRTAYEAAHSITIGETGHGPLVHVPHRWTDRLAAPTGNVLTDINLDGRAAGQVPSSDGEALVSCFAEGVTGPDQSTRLVLSNPGQSDVRVRLSFAYGEASSGPAGATLVVDGGATRSLVLGDIVGFGAVVSVVVTADRPLVCRRLTTVSAYPGPGGLVYNRVAAAAMRDVAGAHASAGITAPAPSWWFAEGYTGPGFETYLAITNVANVLTTVTIDYRLANGSALCPACRPWPDQPAHSRRPRSARPAWPRSWTHLFRQRDLGQCGGHLASSASPIVGTTAEPAWSAAWLLPPG